MLLFTIKNNSKMSAVCCYLSECWYFYSAKNIRNNFFHNLYFCCRFFKGNWKSFFFVYSGTSTV